VLKPFTPNDFMEIQFYFGVVGVAGSNPVAPIKAKPALRAGFRLFKSLKIIPKTGA
jgi:hypothetical protein